MTYYSGCIFQSDINKAIKFDDKQQANNEIRQLASIGIDTHKVESVPHGANCVILVRY